MMEGAVMEYVKWFLGIIALSFIIVVIVFMFRLNEINAFQQEVNYQIERNGGITIDAKYALNEYAKNQYGGYVSFTTQNNDNEPIITDSSDERYDANYDKDREGEAIPFSGFTIVEVDENESGGLYEVIREKEQAKYGTPIKYAMERDIGSLGDFHLKPAVIGESASRVRGTRNDGK